jgi:hypothetical protein
MIALTRGTGLAFGLRPIRLLILKPPSMLNALEGSDDLPDRIAVTERHQEPLIGYVLAEGSALANSMAA